ncbi:uncharacterized protein K441DRAFT_659626 [Cenococcum geophilum 1.58]|uniref:uncharacterized protein n=1 Tax=Cenococcum geophilum 1.58 TaxID=794803 RepID=UPI00358EECFC|nr:hypothetical protein K441DRAFT_659626 [Cenococcum geophilum 1.58]
MGKSRPSGRVGNKRLIIDFLGRMRFGRSPYTACLVAVRGLSVAVCGLFGRVGICIRGRRGTLFKAVL